MRPVPTTRPRIRELAQRGRRIDGNIQRDIHGRVQSASQSSFVQKLQTILGNIQVFFDIVAYSLVLIYQIIKYAVMCGLGILGIVGLYYVFKYALLFFIWVQNTFF